MLKSQKKNSLIINNAIELGELTSEANGKGRKFISRFIEAGVAHYEQFGDVLITKETLDKFIQTMVGCPVIIKHKDITDQNADKERVGVVSRVWFDENDGWFYCEGVIWDKQAIDLVKNQGWNVSCTYDFESDFQKGTYHGKEIDMEFTGGEFLHLALVPNPRYERATIIMNSKDNEKGRWVTIKGTHVFIPDGKQIEEVMKEKGWFSEGKESEKKEKDDLKGKYSREDADFDEKQARKDIEEAKKRGYDTIEKVSEYLGLDEDEVRGFEDGDKEKREFDWEDFDKFTRKETKPKEKKGKIDENLAKDALEQLFSKPFVLQEDEDRFKGAGFEHINSEDIAEATDDEHWGDIESSLEFLKKREKAKAKEQKIKAKEQEAWRKQDALRYGLKSMLKKISPYADFSYDADEKELEVRYFGDWEGDDGSGDYDWQTPTEKTVEKIKKIQKAFKKEYGFELESDWGEKNYFYFKIKDNKKVKNSLDDALCETLAEVICEEVQNNIEYF